MSNEIQFNDMPKKGEITHTCPYCGKIHYRKKIEGNVGWKRKENCAQCNEKFYIHELGLERHLYLIYERIEKLEEILGE